MKKDVSYSTIAICLLSIAIIVMSIGFAVYVDNLNITGTTTVKTTNWNVSFKSDSYKETTGSIPVTKDTLKITETSMEYSVTLSKPGDFYEFTINVENLGSFDANLTGLTMTALDASQSKYLTYKVYYNGNEYNATNSNITGVTLPAQSGNNSIAPVKVRVEYIYPSEAADLPQTDQTITLNASLTFTQAAS